MDYVEIGAGYCKKRRRLRLQLDREYTVKPLNKLKIKHRDRHCKLVALEPLFYSGKSGGYWVHFLDNGRRGKVDAGDLVPIDGDYREWEIG